MEKQAVDRLESMGQISKARLEDFAKRSETFTYRLSKNRLIEGLFLSYESAFYGGGFVPGEDLDIATSQYEKLNGTYGGRTQQMLKDFNLGNIMLATVDSQIVMTVDPTRNGVYLGKNLLSGVYKESEKITESSVEAKASTITFSN